MTVTPVKFDDGDAYDRAMGRWSRPVGERFLDWLAPDAGLDWLDVGCGTGAFTELVFSTCAPATIHGVDPSEGQLDFARARAPSPSVTYGKGGAQDLPFEDGEFDVVAMALAINVVPDTAAAVAEMARVAKPGGRVATYMWDIPGGGFTMEPIRRALRDMGIESPIHGAWASEADALEGLWREAGLTDVSATRIDVPIRYDSFEQFWDWNTAMANTVVRAMAPLCEAEIEPLKDSLRVMLGVESGGPVSYGAFANAVKGQAT